VTVATWTRVCRSDELIPDRGVAALVEDQQVAIFRLRDGDEVVAVGNIDPFSGAGVLSRGIVGSRGDVVTVASPVYKQRFDLRTGRCVDDDTVAVPVFGVRVVDGWIELAWPTQT
jgi:nitrite reductase (NADH) small subunit